MPQIRAFHHKSQRTIDYYKTLANFVFNIGGGLAGIVIALGAYLWTTNPSLPLSNRFVLVVIIFIIALFLLCADAAWFCYIIIKIKRISFVLKEIEEEERAKQKQVSSAGKSPSSNGSDTSTLGLIMEGRSIADERKVVVEVRFPGICSDKSQEAGQAEDSDKSSKEDDRSSSDDLDACKAVVTKSDKEGSA